MAADAFFTITSVRPHLPAVVPSCQAESLALCTPQTQATNRALSTSSVSCTPGGMLPDLQPLWHFNSDDLPDLLAEEPVAGLPEDMRISSADLLTSGSMKLSSADLMMCSDTLQLRSHDIQDLLAYDSADEGSSSTRQHHLAFSPSWNIATCANPSASSQAAIATNIQMATDFVPREPLQNCWQGVATASTTILEGVAGTRSAQRHAGRSSDSQQSGHAAATSQQAAATFGYPSHPVAESSWSNGQDAWPQAAASAHNTNVQPHPHAWTHGATSAHNTCVHMHPHILHNSTPGHQVATQMSGEILMEALDELGMSINDDTLLPDTEQPDGEAGSLELQGGDAGQMCSATASRNGLTLTTSSVPPVADRRPPPAKDERRKVRINRQKQQERAVTEAQRQEADPSINAESEDVKVLMRGKGKHSGISMRVEEQAVQHHREAMGESGCAAVAELAGGMDAAIKALLVALGEPQVAGAGWSAYQKGLLPSLWEQTMTIQEGLEGPVSAVLWPTLRLKERILEKFMTDLAQGSFELPPAGQCAADASDAQALHASTTEEQTIANVWLDFFQEQLREQAMLLWTRLHFRSPTPNKAAKERLGAYSGRNYKQTSDWFTNYRARRWRQEVAEVNEAMAATNIRVICNITQTRHR